MAELCQGARTAIIKKITEGKRLALESRAFETLTMEDILWLDRQKEIAAKEEKSFDYNIPVKYGKELEPYARQYYARKTGCEVEEVGFIEHDSGGFGCSPDGLCKDLFGYSHGVEIKCPIPETHLAWLDDWHKKKKFPEDHWIQCQTGMAVTGLNRWDFLSYCPGDMPLPITVHRDEFTDQLEAGLKTLVAEKAKMKAFFAELWTAEYCGKEDA
jgi:hypothetical protein